MQNQVVVAGALIVRGELLVAQRDRPPELAGRWELPGGKVAPGETEAAALARELAEELGIEVRVGPRLPGDVALNETTTLRAFLVAQIGGATARQRPPCGALGPESRLGRCGMGSRRPRLADRAGAALRAG